ncbi:uncharacterized protein [Mycetomoellerius zeteki]|uniref:uncharacterized protein n=1 Tax=Mycetomoellerius zeteki TaxID=64791 RepID=UPI00084E7CAD|nr:PREDICTED: uncharacterized protein LOC108725674 [Trachymyrmex zeteki]
MVGLDELQKQQRAVIWVSSPPRAAAAVLALLERQNPGIGALNWRVFAENIDASPDQGRLPEICSRNLTAVEVTTASSAGGTRTLVICSAYFPHGEETPPTELVDLCQKEGLPLVVGCDANAYHTIWGSTDTNERGRKLLEYLVTTDLEVLNKGNESTFCAAGRSEVLDLILCSRGSVRKVREWKVSDEPSLSDHRLISFRLSDLKVEARKVRNPKRTDWDSYQRDLERNLMDFPRKHGTARELELCVDHLQRALIGSYEANCPARTIINNRGTPWWNPPLQSLKIKARRAWNRARNTGQPSDWDLYRKTQEYRDSVVEAKKKSWRDFCESVDGIPATARLCRFLTRNPDAALEAVQMSDGTMVSGERCLEHLLMASFPGFRRNEHRCEEVGAGSFRACANDWKLAAEIVRL